MRIHVDTFEVGSEAAVLRRSETEDSVARMFADVAADLSGRI